MAANPIFEYFGAALCVHIREADVRLDDSFAIRFHESFDIGHLTSRSRSFVTCRVEVSS